jgi:hypothetical protein
MTAPLPAPPSAGASGWRSPTGYLLHVTLQEQGQPANRVTFQLNPEKISVSHAAKLQEIPAASTMAAAVTENQNDLLYAALLKAVGETSIVMSNVTFHGANVHKDCSQLLAWTYAKASSSDPKNPVLPKLTFRWGVLSSDVNLISTELTYERFTPDGKPIAAKATLRFNACSLPPTRTNPTSGGLPGRRAHTLVAGENLQHVAVANYGRPGAWRALAAANGVEDPFAVRPGTVIYIPALAELDDGSRE